MRAFTFIFGTFFVVWALLWCVGPSPSQGEIDAGGGTDVTSGTDVTTVATPAAEGLDLETLLPLVKEAKNAEELETKINEKDGVNNLDLNGDGQVDFIKVTEFGNKDAYGFSLTAFPAESEEQEVATIEIKRESEDKALVQVSGNQQIYGHGHHHQTYFNPVGWLMLGYLMAPHSFYMSPWHYGYYPHYYSPYHYRPVGVYRSYTSSYSRGFWSNQGASGYGVRSVSQPASTGLTSPNANKVAAKGINRSLASPTQSQKAFQVRSATKPVKSGGFGRSSGSGATTSKSTARGSSSRGFGGHGK